MSEITIVVVTLGPTAASRYWEVLDSVVRVVTFDHAAPSGSRARSRVLGLGFDSLVVAIRATFRRGRHTYLATNPWIGVALRLLTRRPVVVTGLYAVPGTKQWALLRAILGQSPVITLATIEASNWRADGGRAVAVIYGDEFPYVHSERPDADPRLRVFVGGSSDRDLGVLDALEREVLSSDRSIELVIAIGDGDRVKTQGDATVRRFGRISQQEFGRLLGDADVTFLPLEQKERAAGHMILVGSLQSGTPVGVFGGGGMDGYIDGRFVKRLSYENGVLQALLLFAQTVPTRAETREFWVTQFSREAYLRRLERAIRDFAEDSDPKALEAT